MFLGSTVRKRAFSLCFSRQTKPDRKGIEAGAMTFGGFDRRLHKHDMVYSAVGGEGYGFFSVQLRQVYLREGGGGDSVISSDTGLEIVPLNVSETKMNDGQVILDSGTTDTYMVHQ
jgi:hypothetical protein